MATKSRLVGLSVLAVTAVLAYIAVSTVSTSEPPRVRWTNALGSEACAVSGPSSWYPQSAYRSVTKNWAGAKAIRESHGQRLCTYTEVCSSPYTHLIGGDKTGNVWSPYDDEKDSEKNLWMFSCDLGWPTCAKHQ
ncbi:hypothetical protein T492DRAFT_286137 [Pavlovales sp. CCMP2436]|nr:hypothetical protein T492DRAFT_286137 [Pavlovales sp. CCMP2436]|mmetsp:Transcript_20669/g.52476  ORF Transcript_20669/g.52476 Transcript_20669/m.52476 type:complete len:135 (+) Transcript_20669:151-555(+)